MCGLIHRTYIEAFLGHVSNRRPSFLRRKKKPYNICIFMLSSACQKYLLICEFVYVAPSCGVS